MAKGERGGKNADFGTMNGKKVNVPGFVKDIDDEYTRLYDGRDGERAAFREAVEAGDKALKDRSNKQFVRAVILERGDIFSSDREVAAFALAASKRGLIQKLKRPL